MSQSTHIRSFARLKIARVALLVITIGAPGVVLLTSASGDSKSTQSSAAEGCAAKRQITTARRFKLPKEINGVPVNQGSQRNQRLSVFDVHPELNNLVCFGDAGRTAEALENASYHATWQLLVQNGERIVSRNVAAPPAETRIISVRNSRGGSSGEANKRLLIEITSSGDAGVNVGH